MKTFPERLRWAREKRGLNCSELDEIADLTIGHSAKIERGEREDPSSQTASKLAYALGVDVAWLINGGKIPRLEKSA